MVYWKKHHAVIAFIVPVVILGLAYLSVEIYPFSRNSLLTIDMESQYVSFLSFFSRSIRNNEFSLFSFQNSLGDNIIPLYSYYLLSPFNLFLYFFKPENIIDAIYFITLIKIGSAGLTAYLFFRNYTKNFSYTLILSSCYSLMSYLVVYQQNIMWLDSIILFPLVALGIDQIIAKRKGLLYFISLFFSILTNYYIGYMCLAGGGIYFIFSLFMKGLNIKDISKMCLRFFILTTLAVCANAIVLIPSILRISSKASFKLANFRLLYNPLSLFGQFLIGAHQDGNIVDGLPNLYVGLIILILNVFYFLSRSVDVKSKIKVIILYTVLVSSMLFLSMNLMWHAFKDPAWFPFRQSFIFDFFILLVASYSLSKLEFATKLEIKTLSILLVPIVILEILNKIPNFYINTIYVILYIVVLFWILFISKVKLNSSIIVIIVLSELLFNASLTFKNLHFYSSEELRSQIIQKTDTLSSIQKQEGNNFFRVENSIPYNKNETMLLGYNGINHYSSTSNLRIRSFLEYLGYPTHGIWNTYKQGDTLFTDSLLGIRYRFGPENVYFSSVPNQDYHYNEYAFPLIFETKSENTIIDWNSYNPFINQNLIYQYLSDDSEPLFDRIEDYSIQTQNFDYSMKDSIHVFTKTQLSSEGSINLEFEPQENDIYFNINYDFGAIEGDYADIFVNSKYSTSYFEILKSGVVYIEKSNDLEPILIEILPAGNIASINNFQIYEFNKNKFVDLFKKISANQPSIQFINDGHLIVETNCAKTTCVFSSTIPYDEGWIATRESQKVEVTKFLDNFISFSTPYGVNTTELVFLPNNIIFGGLISLVSLISAFVYFMWIAHKKDYSKN